jgi:hypothetical protein
MSPHHINLLAQGVDTFFAKELPRTPLNNRFESASTFELTQYLLRGGVSLIEAKATIGNAICFCFVLTNGDAVLAVEPSKNLNKQQSKVEAAVLMHATYYPSSLFKKSDLSHVTSCDELMSTLSKESQEISRSEHLKGILHSLRDTPSGCKVEDLFNGKSATFAKGQRKMHKQLKEREEGDESLLMSIRAIQVKFVGSFGSPDAASAAAAGSTTSAPIEEQLQALHARHLLFDKLALEMRKAFDKYDDSYDSQLQEAKQRCWGTLRADLRDVDAVSERFEAMQSTFAKRLAALTARHKISLYKHLRITPQAATEVKQLFDELKAEGVAADSVSLLDHLMKNKSTELCSRWRSAAEEQVGQMFTAYHELTEERLFYNNNPDDPDPNFGIEYENFQCWLEWQCARMDGLMGRYPRGMMMQLVVIAQHTVTGFWLGDKHFNRWVPPYLSHGEGYAEAWGGDCKREVSRLFYQVVQKAIRALEADLVLARWCVYALGTLEADILKIYPKDMIDGDYSDKGLKGSDYGDLWRAYKLILALLPEQTANNCTHCSEEDSEDDSQDDAYGDGSDSSGGSY